MAREVFVIGGQWKNYARGLTCALHIAGDPKLDYDIGEKVYDLTEIPGYGYYADAEDGDGNRYDLIIDGVKHPLWRDFLLNSSGTTQRNTLRVVAGEDFVSGHVVAISGYDTDRKLPTGVVCDPAVPAKFGIVGVVNKSWKTGDVMTVYTAGMVSDLPITYPMGKILVAGRYGDISFLGQSSYPDETMALLKIGIGTGRHGIAVINMGAWPIR